MLDTWGQLLTLAAILTVVSFRWRNVLLSLGASIGWLSLMAYNLDNPPAGITQGSTIHGWLTMGLFGVAMAVIYMWFGTRTRPERTASVKGGRDEIKVHASLEDDEDESAESYRQRVRKALRPNRQSG